MRITNVRVKNLNGSLSYEIPLHPSGITLLTGPNGYGKTSILRLIDAVFNIRLETFAQVAFEAVEVELEDGSGLSVLKEVDANLGFNLRFGIRKPRRKRFRFESKAFSLDDFAPDSNRTSAFTVAFDAFIRNQERLRIVRRLPGGRWRLQTGETQSLEDLQVEFLKSPEAREAVPEEYSSRVKSVNPLFLSAQRLHSSEDSTAVELVSEHVRKRISAAKEEHSKSSQRIDQDFPRKLLSRSRLRPSTEQEVRDTYLQLAALWNRYRGLGLLDEPGFEGFGKRIHSNRLSIAMLFLQDQQKKLDAFRGIEQRLMLLRALVDEHLELQKSVRLSSEKGIEVIDPSGVNIPLSRLSSGEQQLLVLFVTLLFTEPAPSFVLIDEPELSLHPSWQKSFIESVQRIRNLVSVDFVLATHSPTIVEDHLDQMVDLWKSST